MFNNRFILVTTLAAGMFVFTGCSGEENQEQAKPASEENNAENEEQKQSEEVSEADFIIKAAPQKIDHIHGIGYPGNDEGLYVASHHGLKIFKDGQWLETTDENHDYMGFQAFEGGFFASGHPAEGSDLKNPLGLVKSTDKGNTLKKIAFYGESDFHFLSASYKDDVLYLINEEPNSELERGVYVSKDRGGAWELVELNGLTANSLGMIAVHPEKGGTIAMSTREGIFVSNDYGKTMERAGDYQMVTAAAYSKGALYIAPVVNEEIKLIRLSIEQGNAGEEVTIPNLKYDNPITYIAADPEQEDRIAFITILNDLYETEDGGKTWNQLLVNGRIE
ncbi:F510_1955 family glycosylhydrolase [Mesobacillus jeotgali]|uniref:F510_1955 family glycosylhydrolase n=1 Tax=Mesobacillus jeotgali TaxID=129985 RepID=UPI000C84FE9B|nr:sialidase family protein [Mesobacillus jeotgali]